MEAVGRAVVDRGVVGRAKVLVVTGPGVSVAVTAAVAVGMGRAGVGAGKSPVLAVRDSGSSRS
ncbi:hypothetical protein POL68_11160 [Stigmatella sp. ncwal1]|uniref:Uncharacterized protein n=1 Tax=Stigmatella ashevillensis TaxID=2995309 RepID=A0ABT5D9V1_9BACT|nr:hypothetical protein [Stigmatella ashevillena]MDC0709021.1 hypothetical protein [Stigmatella ashevillena]